MLNYLILSKSLDFLFLTEIGQRNIELGPLVELCPKEYFHQLAHTLDPLAAVEDWLWCSGAASYVAW